MISGHKKIEIFEALELRCVSIFPSPFQVPSKPLPSPFQASFLTGEILRICTKPLPRMVSQTIYKRAIDALTCFEGIEQRVQFTMGGNVYDIDWDSANERVIVYEADEKWWEICHNDVEPSSIRLIDVMSALNCVSEDTFPILAFPQNGEYTIDNYLVTPISAPFLIQMAVVDRSTVAPADAEATEADEDPSSSEEEEECNESDGDCDDPNSSEDEV
jgi:hypothetical protein